MALYQTYSDDSLRISQASFPLAIYAPLGNGLSAALNTRQGIATGDDIESLSGLSDTQLTFGYVKVLGRSSLTVSLGLNLPSGKRELSDEEFKTLVLVSQTAFDFRVPNLGQDFGVSPGFTLALPLSDNFVVGVGASYRIRGGFKPLAGMESNYAPGNELLLTSGLDTRLGPSTSLSIDATYASYAADELGDRRIFAAGSKITIAALVRHVLGFNELRLMALYRAREKSSQIGGSALASEGVQTVPNEFTLYASYAGKLDHRIRIRFHAEGRLFDETRNLTSRSVFDIGISPSVRLSQESTLTTQFIYTAGSITGFEGGAGLSVQL